MTEAPEVRFACSAYVDEQGVLRPDDAIRWRAGLLRYRDRRVTVTVSRERRGRTLPQLRYLFGVAYPLLSEWAGYTKDEWHEIMKRRHLKRSRMLPNGEEVESHETTKRLTIEEMGDFIDAVLRDAAEWGSTSQGRTSRRGWRYEALQGSER